MDHKEFWFFEDVKRLQHRNLLQIRLRLLNGQVSALLKTQHAHLYIFEKNVQQSLRFIVFAEGLYGSTRLVKVDYIFASKSEGFWITKSFGFSKM